MNDRDARALEEELLELRLRLAALEAELSLHSTLVARLLVEAQRHGWINIEGQP